MNKGTLESVVQLTRDCLERFWQKDMDLMIEHLSKDVVFVAAQQEQFCVGRDETIKSLNNIRGDLQPCHLRNSEFYIASNDGRSCTIVGRYLVTTDADADFFLQAQQRCTVVWKKNGEELEIEHYHVSNPIGELKVIPGEHFVNKVGKMAKKYIEEQLLHLRDNRKISVITEDNGICFIYLSDIMYVEAIRKYVYIYTLNGEIHAKSTFTDLMKKLEGKFVQVHRSYIVNIEYVKHIDTNKVIMSDEKEIPIPAKRFSQIKKELLQLQL